MRFLLRTVVALLALGAVGATLAVAAPPRKGASYEGRTVSGDEVQITVSKNGRSGRLSLDCESGGAPVVIRNLSISPAGTFAGSAKRSGETILRVSGRFRTAKRATGVKRGAACLNGRKAFGAKLDD